MLVKGEGQCVVGEREAANAEVGGSLRGNDGLRGLASERLGE